MSLWAFFFCNFFDNGKRARDGRTSGRRAAVGRVGLSNFPYQNPPSENVTRRFSPTVTSVKSLIPQKSETQFYIHRHTAQNNNYIVHFLTRGSLSLFSKI